MTRPRLLADHDLNEHIISGLLRREPDADIVRCREVGLADRPDAEVLEYGAAHGRIVVSHDVNTMPAHAFERIASRLPMSGLVMVQQSMSVSAVIESLLLIITASDAEEWSDVVCFLPL